MAILLVILLHAHATVNHLGGDIAAWLTTPNAILRQLRMPLFYFSSGVLAYWGLDRPWREILSKRVLALLWVIVLWTMIYAILNPIIPVNAWEGWVPTGILLIKMPFGVLWFIYAILILSVIMKITQPLPLYLQVAAVLMVNAAVLLMVNYEIIPTWRYLLDNLARYGIFFFAVGCWLAPLMVWFFEDRSRALPSLAISGGIWVVDMMLGEFVPLYGKLPVTLRSIPDLVFGVSFAAALTYWSPARRFLSWLGCRTIGIFLFHPIMIGIALFLIPPVVMSSATEVLTIFALAVGLSVLADRSARAAGMTWLFNPPRALPLWRPNLEKAA